MPGKNRRRQLRILKDGGRRAAFTKLVSYISFTSFLKNKSSKKPGWGRFRHNWEKTFRICFHSPRIVRGLLFQIRLLFLA
jgi:hypothetical protein